MRGRAAKRQKHNHEDSTGSSEDSQLSLRSDDSQEEDIQSSISKRIRTKNEAEKKDGGSAVDRKPLVARQKQPSRGLKQAELSFSQIGSNPQDSRVGTANSTKPSKTDSLELEDDLIEDEIKGGSSHGGLKRSFGEDNSTRVASNSSSVKVSKARPLSNGVSASLFASRHPAHPRSFQQPTLAPTANSTEHLPWAQRYFPRTLEELGVHKRKVSDVRSWLDNVFNGYERKRLLVLRGPPGSGKTATIRMLSSLLEFDILEWRNPATTTTAAGEYQSGTALFEDFLSRGQRYGSLDLSNSAEQTQLQEDGRAPAMQAKARRIILMEEDPHVFSSNTNSLRNFRESVIRYLQAEDSLFGTTGPKAASSLQSRPPVVIIISESSGTSSGSYSDSLSAHRLLGPDILQHPRATSIEFNPVATTILTKALELVAARAYRDGATTTQASPAILHKIAEHGDLRAAIAALEFMCRQPLSTTRPPPRRSKAAKKAPLTVAETALVESVTTRSSMLDLFHAVGKVVYNKRTPAAHNPEEHVSEVDVDRVLDDTGRDSSTLVAALHENYALSCDGVGFVDALNACTEALSAADLLGSDPIAQRPAFAGSDTGSGGGDAVLRQADLAAHVAIAGILYGLPYPVKRTAAGAATYAGGRDAFKMFYPESIRVRGRAEEVLGVARSWAVAPSSPLQRQQQSGDRMGSDPGLSLSRGIASVKAVLLDEVPYRAIIGAATGASQEYMTGLELMAKLKNSAWSAPDEAGDSTSKGKAYAKVKWATTLHEGLGGKDGDTDGLMNSFIKGLGDKWVLSDDDIEDD